MINFSFSLRNPFSKLFRSKVLVDTRVFDHKFIEIEYIRNNELIGCWFNWSLRQSHAGISLGMILFSFGLYVTFEDVRHWDYDNNCWEKYDDEIEGC